MDINRGTQLGPYEIVQSIGAGGMGEVWQAKDTRLDRSVAIKILPRGLAHDQGLLEPGRLAQLQQYLLETPRTMPGAFEIGCFFVSAGLLGVVQGTAHHRKRCAQLVCESAGHCLEVMVVFTQPAKDAGKTAAKITDLIF